MRPLTGLVPWWSAKLLGISLCAASTVLAAESPEEVSLGPGAGSGQRAVPETRDGGARPTEAAGTASVPAPAAAEEAPYGVHRKGRAPSKPSPTLPEGAPRAPVDRASRHAIADGPTRDELRQGIRDPQLDALRAADRILFPEPLIGAAAGWDWLGPPSAVSGAPSAHTSGLPGFGQEPAPALSDEEQAWLSSLVKPDLPVRMDSRVVKYLKFYRDSARGQAIARAWAKKRGRYADSIQAMLVNAGLPRDLVWLSLIESGHNPVIRSPAGAAGLWQFIPSTATMYGLTVDRWVDERLDPRRATDAAIAFLSDLHDRLGNWELAMAAYNMGPGGLTRAIRKYNTNDFWDLGGYEAGIPWETTLYVPKILATALVMNNKKAFGIENIDPDPEECFDVVEVDSGTSLEDVARAAGVEHGELRALNPQYLSDRIPPAANQGSPRRWPARLPRGVGAAAAKALARGRSGASGLSPYVVLFGDTVADIAADASLEPEAVRSLNRIGVTERLESGTVLLLPRHSVEPRRRHREVVTVPPRAAGYQDRRRVFYSVVRGDTLGAVARVFGVASKELAEHNAIDPTAKLQGGMVLQVFVAPDRDLSGVRHLDESDVRVLIAGTPKFFEHFEELNGRRRVVVQVASGDTFSGLARRHGMSVGSLERVNRRSRRDPLSAGEKLVVYTKSTAKGLADGALEPLADAQPPRPELLPSPD